MLNSFLSKGRKTIQTHVNKKERLRLTQDEPRDVMEFTTHRSENHLQDPLIVVRCLIHIYENLGIGVSRKNGSSRTKTIALRGIDLDVNRQTMTAIVGESGSGKTTLLNIIGGLLRPTYGNVIVDGHHLEMLSSVERHTFRNRYFGFIQQFSHQNLFFDLTARENIDIPLLLRDFTRKKMTEWMKDLIDTFSLKDLLQQPTHDLSGGERQLISLIVAIAHDPLIILADEPTSEMDPSMAKKVLEIFKWLTLEHEKTIIITTHDPTVVKSCDHVIRLRKGVIEGMMDQEGLQHKTLEEIHELMTRSFQYLSVDQQGRITFPRKLLEEVGIKEKAFAIIKGRTIILSGDVRFLRSDGE